MRSNNFNISELIEYLRGTTNNLDQALTDLFDMDYEDLNYEDFQQIDDEIFCCACCGWWVESSEKSEQCEDEEICLDCEDSGI